MGTFQEAMSKASSIGIYDKNQLPYSDSSTGTSSAMFSLRTATNKFAKSKIGCKEIDNIFDKKNL